MTWTLHSPLRVRLHEGSVLPKMHARQVPRRQCTAVPQRRGPSGVAAHDVQHAGATSMPTGKDLCPARVEVGLRLNQRPMPFPHFSHPCSTDNIHGQRASGGLSGRSGEINLNMSRRRRDLQSVLLHLDMLMYGADQAALAELTSTVSRVPRLYHMFANANLINTLFLVDKRTSPMGGYVFRALSQHGLKHLLDDIEVIVNAPIGRTTFGDIIRHNRNKLMVH